ncbi:hypothetical protein GQ600_21970 [Phytophthora cactorum]|nr:hypothetical protein GQ600_21970 [Phytophthora cactorum]
MTLTVTKAIARATRSETYMGGPNNSSSVLLELAGSVHRGPIHESDAHSQRPSELHVPVMTDEVLTVQSSSELQNAMPDTAVYGLSVSV